MDFYPRPPCGGRPAHFTDQLHTVGISIHVPLAGDDNLARCRIHSRHISIHVPLAGDDLFCELHRGVTKIFLSTSPLRGTTGPEQYAAPDR